MPRWFLSSLAARRCWIGERLWRVIALILNNVGPDVTDAGPTLALMSTRALILTRRRRARAPTAGAARAQSAYNAINRVPPIEPLTSTWPR
jgi:hypothetical protein